MRRFQTEKTRDVSCEPTCGRLSSHPALALRRGCLPESPATSSSAFLRLLQKAPHSRAVTLLSKARPAEGTVPCLWDSGPEQPPRAFAALSSPSWALGVTEKEVAGCMGPPGNSQQWIPPRRGPQAELPLPLPLPLPFILAQALCPRNRPGPIWNLGLLGTLAGSIKGGLDLLSVSAGVGWVGRLPPTCVTSRLTGAVENGLTCPWPHYRALADLKR